MGIILERPALKFFLRFAKMADENPFSPGIACEIVTFLLLTAVTGQMD